MHSEPFTRQGIVCTLLYLRRSHIVQCCEQIVMHKSYWKEYAYYSPGCPRTPGERSSLVKETLCASRKLPRCTKLCRRTAMVALSVLCPTSPRNWCGVGTMLRSSPAV